MQEIWAAKEEAKDTNAAKAAVKKVATKEATTKACTARKQLRRRRAMADKAAAGTEKLPPPERMLPVLLCVLARMTTLLMSQMHLTVTAIAVTVTSTIIAVSIQNASAARLGIWAGQGRQPLQSRQPNQF
jgi:hypothetical protein